MIVEKILRNLPNKLEHIVFMKEETKDMSKLLVYELIESLEAHEETVNK